MKTILAINTVNYGSTGRIMVGIGEEATCNGYTYWYAYAPDKKNTPARPNDIVIMPYFVRQLNEAISWITGMRGFVTHISTRAFLHKVNRIKPEIIHIHNLHNNYINIELLFKYIKKKQIKVVWTLHDCWSFTARCPYFDLLKCDKWKDGCSDCPYPLNDYPRVRINRSEALWKRKKQAFCGVKNMIIVTPSEWLASLVKESFLSEYPVQVINNGIDLQLFCPENNGATSN